MGKKDFGFMQRYSYYKPPKNAIKKIGIGNGYFI
jgi:hypothetical protein